MASKIVPSNRVTQRKSCDKISLIGEFCLKCILPGRGSIERFQLLLAAKWIRSKCDHLEKKRGLLY